MRDIIEHDYCSKHRFCYYGGPGCTHILENVVPYIMRGKVMTEEHINTILAENPKRLLQFV